MHVTADQKQQIRDFLKFHVLSVVSTVDLSKLPPRPESALVAFTELENFELLFETFARSRKYANLQQNSHVAFVIGGTATDYRTLQYEGIADEIPAAECEKYIKVFLAKKTPATEQVLRNPHVRLFKVRPSWMRFSDYSQGKPVIIEGTFQKNGQMECSC